MFPGTVTTCSFSLLKCLLYETPEFIYLYARAPGPQFSPMSCVCPRARGGLLSVGDYCLLSSEVVPAPVCVCLPPGRDRPFKPVTL